MGNSSMSVLEAEIRRLFDLREEPLAARPIAPGTAQALLPPPGCITYLTGPSGGGKTRLLRAMRRIGERSSCWIQPRGTSGSSKAGRRCCSVIESVCEALSPGEPAAALSRGMALLARVGLAEAWTYLRKPGQLSEGERWRLSMARMLARAQHLLEDGLPVILAVDEFAVPLDRVTAVTVARALRRLIDQDPTGRLSAVVVTSHEDLRAALEAEIDVFCDFGLLEIRQRHRIKPARTGPASISGKTN